MSNKASPQTTPKPPTLWQQICWPLIVVGLLLCHTMIMLVAMTFAMAGPPLDLPDDYGKEVLSKPARELTIPRSQAQ